MILVFRKAEKMISRLHITVQPRFHIISALIAILLFMAPFSQGIVAADGETTLSVLPPAGDVLLNESLVVTLYAENTVDLNAFDVTVTYDPMLVTLTAWSHGTLLSNISNVVVTNNPGLLRVVATQRNTPGVSSSGILLNLTFMGIAYGTSPITITNARFSNTIPVSTYPLRQNGTLEVYGDPTAVTHDSFRAVGTETEIVLIWKSLSEIDLLGFNLYRSKSVHGKLTQINPGLIPCDEFGGGPSGSEYRYTDTDLQGFRTYYYWLEYLDIYAETVLYGPVEGQLQKVKPRGN